LGWDFDFWVDYKKGALCALGWDGLSSLGK
jgi:hypothetical protein